MNRADLAGKWAGTLAELEYVPASPGATVAALHDLIDAAVGLISADDFDRAAALDTGARLISWGYRAPITLQASMEVLGRGLPVLDDFADHAEPHELDRRIVAFLGAMAGGFTEGARQRLFDQQQDVVRALTIAKEHSDARFREVFTTTAVGMAISQLDGKLVDTNVALAEILGYGTTDPPAATIFDIFHPDDRTYLRQRYEQLTGADVPRFRERRRLIGKDGDEKWAFLSVSLFRLRRDTPRYHVTMIEDITDLHLLEDRLSFQVLHDALTGLPNREHFVSKLEATAAQLPADDVLTVYHLALDNVTAVNDGLGRAVGDKLLLRVARLLREVVAEEKAMVARLGGVEFAILIHQTPTAPPVQELAMRINEQLAEPVYIEEGRAVASSATIGVVQRRAGAVDAAELMRIADVTLRRVKAKGRCQWGLADAELDAEAIAHYTLAATVPGAWERGELDVWFRPQVELATGTTVAVRAELRWEHPELGMLGHARCMEIIEDTGLGLTIGRALLRIAVETAARWHAELGDAAPALALDLSVAHAADPDLVRHVRDLITEFDLPAGEVRIGMPVAALCTEDGDAEDNLTTVVDLGITAVLNGFGRTRGDLACLEDLPVHIVAISESAAGRATVAGSLYGKAMLGLVELVRGEGVKVLAPGLDDDARTAWWRAAGADIGQGECFAESVRATEIVEVLRARVSG
ncbi:EAL domain-containing protein [Labedaea rhizosphaerae]|uniref:PAS domain S-box-containing protein/diguanylate cyclase (GGDEF)-like protein n=1 Tax=Labedaea rhizosphaerae TaxID=598644 RepID=A0A4R6SH00_LABRH|nr:EAL domain-containing protein [Labedaea rhizosphaerae]TDQ01055.1 PAS domain S-box-containing protein/diguanylate cyclase (GGDEF)-like protein [Labedaea rhizosphaerae]